MQSTVTVLLLCTFSRYNKKSVLMYEVQCIIVTAPARVQIETESFDTSTLNFNILLCNSSSQTAYSIHTACSKCK